MLNIQKYLVEGGSLEELEAKYCIYYRIHNRYDNLYLFRYDTNLNPNFSLPIVRECRGIILDKNDNWRIVCRSFDKFFNYGETNQADIDWSTAQVQEKMDGSLIQFYWYDNHWEVSTQGMPDASGVLHNDLSGRSFAEYIWEVYNKSSFKLPDNGDHCFYFELTSPYNRIVVEQREAKFTLLGARNLTTQQEITPVEASKLISGEVAFTKTFDLANVEEMVSSFEDMDPVQQEGYVVCDANFNRIKVKHPGYVRLHYLKEYTSSIKNIANIIRQGEQVEAALYFPEFKPVLDEFSDRLEKFIAEREKEYSFVKDLETNKEFAFSVQKYEYPHILYAVRNGYVRAEKAEKLPVKSIREVTAKMRLDNLLYYLGYKS